MSTIHNHLLPLSLWTAEDSNVIAKLRLKKQNVWPTLSTIRQNVGPKLAEAVFSRLDSSTKVLIGLGKALEGPGSDLWSQPKMQLMGEIVLEPYPTRRHRQALTHQSILDYGAKCMEEWEKRVVAEKESEMREKMREQEERMNEILETKINQIRTKEREDFLVRVSMMERRLEERHQREMEALERKLREEGEAQISEIMERMGNNSKCETQALLAASQNMLTNRFHFRLNWMRSDLEEDYHEKLSIQTKLLEMKMKKEIDAKKCVDEETLMNEMFSKVVCTACLTTEFLIKEFKEKMETYKKDIIELNECVIRLTEERECLEKQNAYQALEIKSWDCVIKDIVKHFQKFIEFHMNLYPDGKSFLISWDKVLEKQKEMMIKLTNVKKQETSDKVQQDEPGIKSDSLTSSYICDNRGIISIISSIIRRVIPSETDVVVATEQDVNTIIEDVIKHIIPSSSAISIQNKSQETVKVFPEKTDVAINLEKKLCPIVHRSEYVCIKDQKGKKKEPTVSISLKTDEKPLEDDLKTRVAEIIKILDNHPNIMKFIQGS